MNTRYAIIIPCHNEEHRFLKNDFEVFYDANPSFSFCLVNDGSTDNTSKLLLDLQKGRNDRIHIIDRKTNRGKAESVREGMLYCEQLQIYSWIGFFDADFATPLQEFVAMLEFAKTSDSVLVMGSRFRRLGSNIQRSTIRFYIGRVFASATSLALGMSVYDTQCGAKIMRTDIIANVFQDRFISPWLFDIEILFRIIGIYGRKTTQNIIVEYPLNQWLEIKGSKLKLKDFIVLPLQLLKIWITYRKK